MGDNYKIIKKYNKKMESIEKKIKKQEEKITKYKQKKKKIEKKVYRIYGVIISKIMKKQKKNK